MRSLTNVKEATHVLSLMAVALLSALSLTHSAPAATPTAAPLPTALVVQDATALRAAPREAAPLHAQLARGAALELRGAQGDWWQVWDHAAERGGFVRAATLLPLPNGAAALEGLRAQLQLVRQQPGAEGLGLGLAAALIERADGDWLASSAGAEVLDTLGELQARLAERANRPAGTPAQQSQLAAQLELARRYGWAPQALAQPDGSQRLCAQPEADRQLLGLKAASPTQRAHAALRLTEGDCVEATLLPSARLQHDTWRVEVLAQVEASALPPHVRNRLLLRRASVQASLAFARRADTAATQAAAEQAWAAWMALVPAALSEDDSAAQREAALRIAPLRWALQPEPAEGLSWGALRLRRVAGEAGLAGQQCVALQTAQGERLRRCTQGRFWLNSVRRSPDGQSLVMAVQPLEGWTELWRIQVADGSVQVLPPAAAQPGLGVAEWAGWSGSQLLVAREAWAEGRALRRFEVLGADLLQPLRWSPEAQLLGAFQRGADPAWKAGSPLAR
ncbi:hypothetical protein [Inhella gelatinilytica]|uniref:SH3 domain-containing protein n=1 Tax=Inhella gelatinilytica TaxID=2795030 RepID=A0A931ISQ9_9BURK|nr:hypothetical protein [Inhella gelatinilytica]MBH9552022.1 hypothetical protein [Inhella gelatinilytica]